MIYSNYYSYSYYYYLLLLFFISTKSKNQKGVPLLSLGASGIKKPFSEVALQTRESLKRPYFPLPLSILAGTHRIMLLLYFFCNPVWFSGNSRIRFPGKFILVWFPRKSMPNPQGKQKKKICFFYFLLPMFFGSVLGVSLLLCHSI